MFGYFRPPVGWIELLKRTAHGAMADNVLNLAAQLGFYFLLGLFPALMFLVALISVLPVQNVVDQMLVMLGEVAPPEAVALMETQIREVGDGGRGGLLTFGILIALWSSSTALVAVIQTLNHAYNIEETRPWWRLRLTAILLTVGAASFIALAFLLIALGPLVASLLAGLLGAESLWIAAWQIGRWPLAVALVIIGIDLIYYFAPNADQDWVWITPGAVLAVALWILGSLGFSFYLGNFGDYDATYGALAGVIVLMLWFYLTGVAILMGAELNAAIEKASEDGQAVRQPAQPDQRKKIGAAAARARAAGEANATDLPDSPPQPARDKS